MKYEFKGGNLDKVNGLDFYQMYGKQPVRLQRLNDDVAVYFSELYHGRTFGTKEYYIFDIKKNQFVENTYDPPSKDQLKKYTNSNLRRVNENVEEQILDDSKQTKTK